MTSLARKRNSIGCILSQTLRSIANGSRECAPDDRLRYASRRMKPRQDCICIKDDITSVLSACVGFDPMPPPTPLVVFCIYWLTACWNDVPMEGEPDCDFACGGASTLGLLPTAETMTASSESREQIASLCYGLMVNAR
jgi:hypothetical protein